MATATDADGLVGTATADLKVRDLNDREAPVVGIVGATVVVVATVVGMVDGYIGGWAGATVDGAGGRVVVGSVAGTVLGLVALGLVDPGTVVT